jgi:transposase InsO family protein
MAEGDRRQRDLARPLRLGPEPKLRPVVTEEFYRMLDGVVIDDTQPFNDKLQQWEDFYNFHRPHGGLDGQTPYERLRQKTTTPPA